MAEGLYRRRDVKPKGLHRDYWLSLEDAYQKIKEHQELTGVKYFATKTNPSFGDSAWSLAENKLLWEESNDDRTPLKFDGVPYLLLATKQLVCQYGAKKAVTDHTSKAVKCPAKILMKEVIKFTEYKIENNSGTEKLICSKMIREDLCCGSLKSERRIYVFFPDPDVHTHSVLVKKGQESSRDGKKSELHCLICNGKLSDSTRSSIPLFTGKIVTTHQRRELCSVLGGILDQQLHKSFVHSTILCSKCFSLVDDIDLLEEQVTNKKQMIVDRYKMTVSELNQTTLIHSPENSDDDDDDDDDKDDSFGISLSPDIRLSNRRPVGATKKRGRPKGRPRGRTKSSDNFEESCFIKLEVEEAPQDDSTDSPFSSQPCLRTIKKEDIMDDFDPMEDSQHSIVRINALDADEEDRIEIPIDEDSVSMEFHDEVLEVVEEFGKDGQEGNSKTFTCEECDKNFPSKATLKNHIKVHSQQDSYECDECQKTFSTKYRLKSHLKTHENREKSYGCHFCSKFFYTQYQLNAHLKSHDEGRNFVCELCGKSLATGKTLELHLLTHTGEKPYQCEICGATFRQRSNLVSHIKGTHYQEKKYSCNFCQRSFVRKRLLEYHMNSAHTGVRPYRCEVCSATFVYPHYFKRHIRKHTGDKPHKCEICEKAFASKENRNAHMFIHSDKKPYECKVCCAGFMRKPLCIAHLAVHGQVEGDPEAYITFNSPSLLVMKQEVTTGEEEEDEVAAQTIHAVTLAEEEANSHHSIEEQAQIIRGERMVKLASRPVHIIEADETTRYVIHSADRVQDSNMEHFFAELQGQVVEVRSEDF